MVHGTRFAAAACALLMLPGAAAAEDPEIRWSASLEAALHNIASHEADDDVTGFFDQYQFIPNKSSALPVELGLSEAAFDLLGAGETPELQFRLDSPTSNLGISGSEADHPFLNQRALLSGRLPGFSADVHYRRLRTEDLRRYPDPSGSGIPFTDLTGPGDRFFQERTGFDATLRFRPQDSFEGLPGFLDRLGGEVDVRGGYQGRDGQRQRRFLLSADWISLDQKVDQEVGSIGGGVLVAPHGWFTLALDVDHQRFRENASTLTDTGLGAPFPSSTPPRPIGFVPDTDRTTASARIRSHPVERVDIRGAFQWSRLEQVDSLTPGQRQQGLDQNEVQFVSANLLGDVRILDALSANAFFKFDERDNRIDPALLRLDGQTQVNEFLKNWRRFAAGGELVYAFHGPDRVAVGARMERVERDLRFDPNAADLRILATNALVADTTQTWTVYGRTRLRPLRGLGVRAELGYRGAPKTGYVVDLDRYVYGKADVSYVLELARPVALSAFARGGSGRNRDFSAVGGLGPNPSGAAVDRNFDRMQVSWGVSATSSPWKRVTLFSSFFQSRDDQDYRLVLSDQPRYYQDTVPLVFTADGPVDYRSDDLGVVLGADFQLDERTDAGLSYSFNRIDTRYRRTGSTSGNIATIADEHRIDADIHRVALHVGRRLREGLRVTAGYSLDLYDDRSPPHGAGVVPPFDLGTYQHTVTVGVTLTNELLKKK